MTTTRRLTAVIVADVASLSGAECRLVALYGHRARAQERPLSGEERTRFARCELFRF